MKRILAALIFVVASAFPAMAGYSYPRLQINTGPGGQEVTINATIVTLTTLADGVEETTAATHSH